MLAPAYRKAATLSQSKYIPLFTLRPEESVYCDANHLTAHSSRRVAAWQSFKTLSFRCWECTADALKLGRQPRKGEIFAARDVSPVSVSCLRQRFLDDLKRSSDACLGEMSVNCLDIVTTLRQSRGNNSSRTRTLRDRPQPRGKKGRPFSTALSWGCRISAACVCTHARWTGSSPLACASQSGLLRGSGEDRHGQSTGSGAAYRKARSAGIAFGQDQAAGRSPGGAALGERLCDGKARWPRRRRRSRNGGCLDWTRKSGRPCRRHWMPRCAACPRLRALLDQPGLAAERPDERIDAAAGTVPSDLDAG